VTAPRGGLHHVELWVADLAAALPPWRWLLERAYLEDAAGYEVELVARPEVTGGSGSA
jgi:hypothetical protein